MDQKLFWVQKSCWSKKFCVQKSGWSKKNFVKKMLGLNKLFVLKIYDVVSRLEVHVGCVLLGSRVDQQMKGPYYAGLELADLCLPGGAVFPPSLFAIIWFSNFKILTFNQQILIKYYFIFIWQIKFWQNKLWAQSKTYRNIIFLVFHYLKQTPTI